MSCDCCKPILTQPPRKTNFNDDQYITIKQYDDLKSKYEKAVEALRTYAYEPNYTYWISQSAMSTAKETLAELGEKE
jgi:hypothetical protein